MAEIDSDNDLSPLVLQRSRLSRAFYFWCLSVKEENDFSIFFIKQETII